MGRPVKAQNDDVYERGLALARAGHHAEAIGCFETALLSRPGDMRVLFALGNTAAAIGHADAAENFFRRALKDDPDRLEILVNLANLLRKGGRTNDTIALLKPAIERKPEQAELWLTLGSALREAGNAGTAEIFYREALRLKPAYMPALGNLADLLADQGGVDEALQLFERALANDPENPQARLNRAFLFLMKGDLAQGWRDYDYRLAIPDRVIHSDHRLPLWNGDFRRGAKLLVSAEQGIGDQLMFASVIPDLIRKFAAANGSVILEAEPRLVPLLARSFPDVVVHAADIETRGGQNFAAYDWLQRNGGADAAIALGSLPRFLRKGLSDFPSPHSYLVPDPAERERWSRWLRAEAEPPYVGLCWRSGLSGGLRGIQYAPLEFWAEFIRSCPGTPVALQYDLRTEEFECLLRLSERKIVIPPKLDQKQEIDRTAAMIAALDAVVSAPTSVSWIAAPLGVPTLKLLYNNCWTSFGADYEPFAPACRCIMPEKSGDWRGTFAKALSALSLRG